MSARRLSAYVLLLIVSVIWAIASPVIKVTLEHLSPLLFLTYRFFLSSILGLIIFAIKGVKVPRQPKVLIGLVIYGLLTSTVTLGLFFLGLDKTTVIESSIISLIGPLIITIAGVVYLNEKVTKREQLGITITIAGMVLTVVEPIISNGYSFSGLVGNLLIVGYLVTNACSVVICKKLSRVGVSASDMTNWSFILGFLSLLPLLLFRSSPTLIIQELKNVPFSVHLSVAYMAILSGTVAYWLYTKAQKSIEVSESALFSYLYPLLSIPIAIFLLKEKITYIFIIGAVIILLGVVVAEYKKPKKE